jgi:uncharacterized protein YdbL (DUF1318 family)
MAERDATAKKLAETENADRWTVYQEIAKEKNTTADLVAKRRALRNIARAAAGSWIQNPDGKWRQKLASEPVEPPRSAQ